MSEVDEVKIQEQTPLEKLKDAFGDLWWKLDCDNSAMFNVETLKNKRLVVSWSGGWDSTVLLMLMAFKYGTHDAPVIAHATKSANIGSSQQRLEQRKMEELKKILTEDFKLPIEFQESSINIGSTILGGRYNGISQATLNAFSPFLYHTYRNVVICYGYVYKDDFWTVKDDFLDCVKAYGRILGNPNAEVAFPLYSISKKDIRKFLKSVGLLEHTWYCENPDGDSPCGKCGSCKRVSELLLEEMLDTTKDKESEVVECDKQ